MLLSLESVRHSGVALLCMLACPGVCRYACAAPPVLFHQSAFESPVRADPDDLLQLTGSGLSADDQVVYQLVSGVSGTPTPPTRIPEVSTAVSGVAPIVTAANVPYSLTIRLPQILQGDHAPYALWVHAPDAGWSEPVEINDARPLWFSPDVVYSTGGIGGLPRELKVVGRNLESRVGRPMRIRLSGPQTLTSIAIVDSTSRAVDRYVARIPLPERLSAGQYRVLVSRDNDTWIEVPSERLQVRANPPASVRYSIDDARFGGCRPDDGRDDSACVVRAIGAAARAGGGIVYLGPGTWDLGDHAGGGLDAREGIVVPRGINLEGAGTASTRLVRHPQWNQGSPTVGFTLLGHNVVKGMTFRDSQVYRPTDQGAPFLLLGEIVDRVIAAKPPTAPAVDDIVITDDLFDRTFVAIAGGGLPISHLIVTHNIFGAYFSALELGGNRYNTTYPYRIDDSIIAYNTFEPGSYLDLTRKQGTLASEIGAAHRFDFSHNVADGTSIRYLYSPEDARGWRAAFFWNLSGSVEEMLVAQNVATCTGDKVGDGEAFSYDNNGNTFAFASAAAVTQSTPTSVSVSASLLARQNGRAVPVESYYVGHWLQIVSGPGLGEVRRIESYSTDPVTHVTTFRVSPEWDVPPTPGGSRITVGQEYWQVYTLDNRVDQRKPPCQKSNRSRFAGGQITLYSQTSDSVVAGNVQYDTSGILLNEVYNVPDHACPDCTMESFFQSFVEIRDNLIDGEYNWGSDCSASGIAVGLAAAPVVGSAPPTMGYGISISHNMITHADALDGGAISLFNPWFAGPPPHSWPLSEGMLIQHNDIRDVSGTRAAPNCGASHARIGIALPKLPLAPHTVLYGNSCSRVAVKLSDAAGNAIRICQPAGAGSCGCPMGSPAH